MKKEKNKIFGKIETLISHDTIVDGVIEASGTIRIDGTVRGGIRKADGVIIGDTGIVEGNIVSKGVNLAGKVKGNIVSETILELLPGSILQGDIETTQLSISEGAHFDGSCTMKDTIDGSTYKQQFKNQEQGRNSEKQQNLPNTQQQQVKVGEPT